MHKIDVTIHIYTYIEVMLLYCNPQYLRHHAPDLAPDEAALDVCAVAYEYTASRGQGHWWSNWRARQYTLSWPADAQCMSIHSLITSIVCTLSATGMHRIARGCIKGVLNVWLHQLVDTMCTMHTLVPSNCEKCCACSHAIWHRAGAQCLSTFECINFYSCYRNFVIYVVESQQSQQLRMARVVLKGSFWARMHTFQPTVHLLSTCGLERDATVLWCHHHIVSFHSINTCHPWGLWRCGNSCCRQSWQRRSCPERTGRSPENQHRGSKWKPSFLSSLFSHAIKAQSKSSWNGILKNPSAGFSSKVWFQQARCWA